jgi:signal transduction histidine kinase
MPLSGRRDELDTVAATVNTMMGEIERLMVQVKGTTDAIAHDLRTPLGHLRLRLGELQRQGGSDAVLGEAIEELDAVLARFSALLRISELDAAGRRACFALFDPMAMLATAAELYEPLAEERGIALTLHGAFGHTIEGDEALVLEAIGNLLDNAIKFTRRAAR